MEIVRRLGETAAAAAYPHRRLGVVGVGPEVLPLAVAVGTLLRQAGHDGGRLTGGEAGVSRAVESGAAGPVDRRTEADEPRAAAADAESVAPLPFDARQTPENVLEPVPEPKEING